MVSAIEKQILQSQVMERIQQVQQQHPDMQQQYFEVQFDQDRRKLKKKVNESKNLHRTTVDEEKRNAHRGHPSWEEEEREPGVDGTISDEQRPHEHIDIKV